MKKLISILLMAELLVAFFVLAPVCILRREHVRAFVAWRENPTDKTKAELDRQKWITTLNSLGFSAVAFGVMAGATLLGVRIFRRGHVWAAPPRMDESTREMVLAYDSGRRESSSACSEGRITRLYFLSYEGEHMFEMDEGERRSSWPRRGDSTWFLVGRRARVEHTGGAHPEVIRIWIGNAA
jgi:hypothetical protein